MPQAVIRSPDLFQRESTVFKEHTVHTFVIGRHSFMSNAEIIAAQLSINVSNHSQLDRKLGAPVRLAHHYARSLLNFSIVTTYG